MSTRASLKLDSRTTGGIAKEHLNGVDFLIKFRQNGELTEFVHNDSSESCPQLRKRLGIPVDEFHCERLR